MFTFLLFFCCLFSMREQEVGERESAAMEAAEELR